MSRLDGRVVVVTGAASGLGEATARLAAAEGAQVVLGDLQREQGEAVAASIGPAATFVPCDVTIEEQVAGLVDSAATRHGRLDGMVNNAGIVGAHGPIDELELAEYEFTMAVLLRSVFLGLKHAARVMKPQGSGSIVSLASIAGVQGGLGPHVYAAAKTGVVGLTRNVAAELGAWGIRVTAVAPGKILTPMNAAVLVGDPDAMDEARVAFAGRTPLRGRIGEARDVAETVVWLLSDAAGFVSGSTIAVDGGLTTGSREGVAPGEHGRWAQARPLVREAGRTGLPSAPAESRAAGV